MMGRWNKHTLEVLERRLCLSVDAALVHGHLFVTGDAEAPVEIRAIGEETFEVQEGEMEPILVEGVTRGIKITLRDRTPVEDQPNSEIDGLTVDPTVGDRVTLDLNGFSVDGVFATLGGGRNHLTVEDGTIAHRLHYCGGPGDDSVHIAEGVSIGGTATLWMGHGENRTSLDGKVEGSLVVSGGHGTDTVVTTGTAGVGGGLLAYLGNGENTLRHAGNIEGSIHVRGGHGADMVHMAPNAKVGDSLFAALGHGANNATINGSIGGWLYVRAGRGDDTVSLGADNVTLDSTDAVMPCTRVGKSVVMALDDGNDRVTFGYDMPVITASAEEMPQPVPVHIGGTVSLTMGGGNDSVRMSPGVVVDGALHALMGDGDNALTLAGRIERSLHYAGGQGNDDVTITRTGSVGGNASLLLGGGENSVYHGGLIEGDLLIKSRNEEDRERINLDDGEVGGEIRIQLGKPEVDFQSRLRNWLNSLRR